jgi:hypothetical protein
VRQRGSEDPACHPSLASPASSLAPAPRASLPPPSAPTSAFDAPCPILVSRSSASACLGRSAAHQGAACARAASRRRPLSPLACVQARSTGLRQHPQIRAPLPPCTAFQDVRQWIRRPGVRDREEQGRGGAAGCGAAARALGCWLRLPWLDSLLGRDSHKSRAAAAPPSLPLVACP